MAGSWALKYAPKPRGRMHRRLFRKPTAPQRRHHGPSEWRLRRARAALANDRASPRGGLGWLEVECNRCKTRASLPLDAIQRPRDMPIWKLEASLTCRSCRRPPRAASADDQAHGRVRNHASQVGASRRGALDRSLSAVRFSCLKMRLGLSIYRTILGLFSVSSV